MKIIKKSKKPIKLTWHASPALIQGVMNHFKVSKEVAMHQMDTLSKMTAKMRIDLSQFPDAKIMQFMMMVSNKLPGNKQKSINNNQGKK